MAQEEVFAGPVSESIPSSVTGFAHRRGRADSTASFTYFEDEDESPQWSEDQAVVDETDDDQSFQIHHRRSESDLERGSITLGRRKSSTNSKASAERPLLRHFDSGRTNVSLSGFTTRSRQKIYVATEDLTIVVAGFSTRWLGYIVYVCLCTITAGAAYLLLRWIPRWRVKLVGKEVPLRECDWTVIEVRGFSPRCKSSIADQIRINGVNFKFRVC